MSELAPIAIFIYKRPEHLRATLLSLRRCEEFADSRVIVFADGPKNRSDFAAVEETRKVAQSMLGDRAEYHLRETNAGLAASIVAGVSDVVDRFGRVIVLEDDLELSDGFLTYLNAALQKYAHDPVVYQVSGQLVHAPEFQERKRALFLPFTSSWGWGTWKRAWERFDPSAPGWQELSRNSMLRRRFNLDNSYDYSTMLERQMAGLIDSWAIRWYWSVFCNSGIVCFPPGSLVRNIGLDGSGTHGGGRFRRFRHAESPRTIDRVELMDKAEVDARDFALIRMAMWRQNGGWKGTVVDRVRRLLFKATGRHM
jgi:hypothetical protein